MNDWPPAFDACLACPSCHGNLRKQVGKEGEHEYSCHQCKKEYPRDSYGYFDFTLANHIYAYHSTTENYAKEQESYPIRRYKDFLRPFVEAEPTGRILEVGCGVGTETALLVNDGYDAYGLDVPDLSKFWDQLGNSKERYFAGDAARLPFHDNIFDMVFSLGVIEHIGTSDGHADLLENYWDVRQSYANEMWRVTKPGGRILIACPNKSFPIDIQHGVEAGHNGIRSTIFIKTGINIHRTWGKHQLLSYGEMKKLFQLAGKPHSFQPLSLKGYFGFGRFKSGFLRPLTNLCAWYVNHLPRFLRGTFFNPYMLVQIRKDF